MADIQHAAIVDPYIHEPKGAGTASAGTVYVSNGTGSGAWTQVDVDSLDYDAVLAAIQADINDGTLALNGSFFIHITLADVSTASSVIVPVVQDSTFLGARLVLGGAITVADSNVAFTNSSGGSMGTAVVVAFTGSAKGTGFTFTATANNVLTAPTWIEIATDGGSTTTMPLYVTLEFSTKLN